MHSVTGTCCVCHDICNVNESSSQLLVYSVSPYRCFRRNTPYYHILPYSSSHGNHRLSRSNGPMPFDNDPLSRGNSYSSHGNGPLSHDNNLSLRGNSAVVLHM